MPAEHELYPLSAFCGDEGIELPPYRVITSAEVPEPYHGLLVHTRDMTSVLQDFHNQNIHLENVYLRRETDRVLRRVTLIREDGRPVEFGAIEISLQPFPDAAQRDILACHTPLGAILRLHEVGYVSKTKGFFEIESNRLIGEALRMETPARLYGRMNVLLSADDRVLARAIEILPPTRDDE